MRGYSIKVNMVQKTWRKEVYYKTISPVTQFSGIDSMGGVLGTLQ